MAPVESTSFSSLERPGVAAAVVRLGLLRGEWEVRRGQNPAKSVSHKNNGAKLNGVRRCDGLREPSFSGRRLGFCTISGPELVWPGGVLRVVASFPSSVEGRYAPDVHQRRSAEEVRRLRSMHRPKPNEAQKRKLRWQRGRSCSRAQPTACRQSASPSRRCRSARPKPYATGASQMACGVPMRSRFRRPRRSSPDR